MKARVVVGANIGDEGKGTVVATYTKESEGTVLNVLTNGGAQRGHSILTTDGNMTFQHFGSGTYFGADNYYSRYFILNPMQFVKEYDTLVVKPRNIYRDPNCRWSTPYDMMANLISEQQKGRHASCCMGIWNTIKRYSVMKTLTFDQFATHNINMQLEYLNDVKKYYERNMDIPHEWRSTWDSDTLMYHFINDCWMMYKLSHAIRINDVNQYDEMIFENGQGLLLCDTGIDSYEKTPSKTGIEYAANIIADIGLDHFDGFSLHYVTRPYLTRHGDGHIDGQMRRKCLSGSIEEDRTNHYNEFQGDFRYGKLDIDELKDRIVKDSKGLGFTVELTHCDEMDRVKEFGSIFENVRTYESPFV